MEAAWWPWRTSPSKSSGGVCTGTRGLLDLPELWTARSTIKGGRNKPPYHARIFSLTPKFIKKKKKKSRQPAWQHNTASSSCFSQRLPGGGSLQSGNDVSRFRAWYLPDLGALLRKDTETSEQEHVRNASSPACEEQTFNKKESGPDFIRDRSPQLLLWPAAPRKCTLQMLVCGHWTVFSPEMCFPFSFWN